MKDFAKSYLDILTGRLAGLNLTRITTEEEFYNKQIVDSLLPIEKSDKFVASLEKTGILVDVGFGGGFPLLPLAKALPEVKCVGFEARGKKAKAVQSIADELELKNVKALHQRIDDVYIDRNCVITLKAVGTAINFLPKIITDKTVRVFFYKGPNFYELEEVEPLLKDWRIVEETYYDVPGTEGRMLIGFENKKVLHGTLVKKAQKKKDKKLVNLSDLL
ncbi:class I SAM-dependent methyltransferase [Halobacteriovorax sp. GB3]|uniref:16S rRNA (guanine(527)-N(7))-methyltransferase RsmG n=1 Tax=Halobacteriovorax sp. GB3 TaxID=2719615 RepID=UPI00235F8BED|nr:RsmG family class I SAM-dependent methyltransferase [Halobacteriovorax sp. GB3]MDD0854735.1 class I SAM-dependent methyltransferase [Halobacteriovorax sp. GB3]